MKTHRIGLNAHLLNLSGNYRSAGISWYIHHLIQHLEPAPDLQYTVFLSESRARFSQCTLARSRLPTHQPIVRIWWEQFIQPIELQRARIDLLHALAFAGPLAISIPWIVTIYDLSFMRYPDSFNPLNRIYLTWAVRHAAHHADYLIAISESTKRDLVELVGARPERVRVIYCGKDDAFAPPTDRAALEAWRAARGVPDKIILFVGTIEPRKNIVRLLRAFARAKRAAHLPHRLVLIGARGWKYAEVDRTLAQENLANDVLFVGYVPQDELPRWYQAADVFVYPSLYEGFGMPPLDAMASGTPVITSNAASLPEVVGDAALQVSPTDEDALADAIIRVLTDPALREQMIARGLAQAARFAWTRAAHETMALYRAVFTHRSGESHATR
ncbi:MAG: glycosyltransferase family 4 protein [Anaerolineae bacterium]|nr:glycosyltransferase family 4 protein [Anaerolineae bacterium]